MLKLVIISEHNLLEILLKQHFTNLEIVTCKDIIQSDIMINDNTNVNIKAKEKTWFLSKPISITNLIDILEQAILLFSENIIKIGSIDFFPKERLCKTNKMEIALTEKETELLLYLAKQIKEVSKADLLHAIWGYCSDIETHTLETHIYKLKNKFNLDLISSNDNGYYLNSLNSVS